MRMKVAGAVLVVLVGLVSSACGSTHAVRTSRPTPATEVADVVPFALPPAANLVILPTQRGVGDERLGSFTASGSVYFELSCKGKGSLTIVRISRTGPCDGSPAGVEIPHDAGSRVDLTVRAKPGTTWRLAVGENVPGATLSLVHSSGSGHESFGIFTVHGTLHYTASCPGPGTVEFNFLSLKTGETRPDGCQGTGIASDVDVQGGRVQISVDAPRKARWSLSVSER